MNSSYVPFGLCAFGPAKVMGSTWRWVGLPIPGLKQWAGLSLVRRFLGSLCTWVGQGQGQAGT